MARYSGVIQNVVKLGYDAFQVTFRVRPIDQLEEQRDQTEPNQREGNIVYRVDVALNGSRLILFPDRELGEHLKMCGNYSEKGVQDGDRTGGRDICRIAGQICQQVSALLFDKSRIGGTVHHGWPKEHVENN